METEHLTFGPEVCIIFGIVSVLFTEDRKQILEQYYQISYQRERNLLI